MPSFCCFPYPPWGIWVAPSAAHWILVGTPRPIPLYLVTLPPGAKITRRPTDIVFNSLGPTRMLSLQSLGASWDTPVRRGAWEGNAVPPVTNLLLSSSCLCGAELIPTWTPRTSKILMGGAQVTLLWCFQMEGGAHLRSQPLEEGQCAV